VDEGIEPYSIIVPIHRMGKRLLRVGRPYLGTLARLEMNAAVHMLLSMLPDPGVERRSRQREMRKDNRLVRVLHTSLIQAGNLAIGQDR
jgi:hypothetical protein